MSSFKSILARTEDGTVQITITIPQSLVGAKKEEALAHIAKNLEVPGFRRGKAPKDVALKHVKQQELYDHLLKDLLPSSYSAALQEHKLRPILAPRFELVSLDEDRDWQIRALTCELPQVDIGDYKKAVKDKTAAGKGNGQQQEQTREGKEQQVIQTLLANTKIQVPRLLVEEEVNHKLARLLEQTQKLGLTIEQYLTSTGKTVENLKAEYAQQAIDGIKLELTLNKIADEERVIVQPQEVDQVTAASGDEETKKALSTPAQKQAVGAILRRRKALDRLVSLV